MPHNTVWETLTEPEQFPVPLQGGDLPKALFLRTTVSGKDLSFAGHPTFLSCIYSYGCLPVVWNQLRISLVTHTV